VHFRIVAPWDERDVSGQLPFGSGNFHMIGVGLILAGVLFGSVVAWRNLRARRGDRQGAWRVAAVLFFAAIASHVFVAEHEVAFLHELHILAAGCAYALLMAASFWLVYIAIEPFIRRRWPQGLISWTRLLAGKWRDPMVGRDVLAGIASGVLHVLIAAATPDLRALFKGEPVVSGAHGSVFLLDAVLLPMSTLANSVQVGAVQGMTAAVLVMLVLIVLRKRALIGPGFFVVFFGLYLFASTDPAILPIFAALSALLAFTIVRFGLLGMAASTATFAALFSSPMPDTAAWYTLRALIPTIAFVALAIWAFRTSLGGQRAFAGSLDE
jgi:hypothetical protein